MSHRRLAAIVLVVALFGANTAMASVCEAYCAAIGKKKSDHHHQTAATPSSPIIMCMLNNIGRIVRNAPRPQGSPRCSSRTVEALLEFRRYRKIREFFPMIMQFPNFT